MDAYYLEIIKINLKVSHSFFISIWKHLTPLNVPLHFYNKTDYNNWTKRCYITNFLRIKFGKFKERNFLTVSLTIFMEIFDIFYGESDI